MSDLQEGQTIKFNFSKEGIKREGFLALIAGKVVAYENVCRHIPISIDYGDNRFFTQDGKHFICRTHGAIYEPLTGHCVQGPCQGAFLFPIPLEIENGKVYLPQELLSA